MVYEAAHAVDIPIIGMGGIMDYKDALEFIMAGATAIQVGTANFVDYNTMIDVADGIEKYLKDNNIEDINEITGII